MLTSAIVTVNIARELVVCLFARQRPFPHVLSAVQALPASSSAQAFFVPNRSSLMFLTLGFENLIVSNSIVFLTSTESA